jgi:putative ABC transport system permease protein
VFRAIGFRQVHITRLILIEAVIASAIAGVLGYAAGMAVTYVVLPLVARSAEVAWAPLLGLSAIVLAVAIGGLASLYPAKRAGRMDPTEALRAL